MLFYISGVKSLQWTQIATLLKLRYPKNYDRKLYIYMFVLIIYTVLAKVIVMMRGVL